MTKGVIFDIGGVLAHDVWEHLYLSVPNGIASKYSLSAAAVEKVGKKLWKDFDKRKAELPDDSIGFEQEYWRKFKIEFPQLPNSVTVESLIEMTRDFIQPVNAEEMNPVLARLKANGVSLAICSNNNEFWFQRQWDKLQLNRFFSDDKVVLSCREGTTKADQRLFKIAAMKLGLQMSECVFIDDRVENVDRALQCGMTGIFFPPGSPVGARYLDSILRKLGL